MLSNSIAADLPGSKLLSIKAADKDHAQYSPGHVLALRIPDAEEEHTAGKHGDGRTAPYTITTCNREKGIFTVLFRVVQGGRMSQRLDKLARKSTILFGGKFKTAIGDAIAKDASHVICITTGVGLGRLKSADLSLLLLQMPVLTGPDEGALLQVRWWDLRKKSLWRQTDASRFMAAFAMSATLFCR